MTNLKSFDQGCSIHVRASRGTSLSAPVKGVSIGITLVALGLSGCNWGQGDAPVQNESNLESIASPNIPSTHLAQQAPALVGRRNLPLTAGMRAFGTGPAQVAPSPVDQRSLTTPGENPIREHQSTVSIKRTEQADLGSNLEASLSSPLEAMKQSPDPQSSVRPEAEASAQSEAKGEGTTGVASTDVNTPTGTGSSDASTGVSTEKAGGVQAPAPDHDRAQDAVADTGADKAADPAGAAELPLGQTGPQAPSAPSASTHEEFAELNRKVEELDALPIVKSTRSGGESEDSKWGGGGGSGKATVNGSGFLGVLSSKSLDFGFGKKSPQPDSTQGQVPATKSVESAPRLPAAAGQAVVSGSQSSELIDFFVANPVLGSFCEASENYIRRGLESAAAPSTRNSRSGLALIRQDLGLPEVVGGHIQGSTETGDRELQLVREAVERARRSESTDSLETSLQRYLSEKGREVPAETIRCGSGETLARDPQSAILRDGIFGVACRATTSSSGELLPPLQVSRVEVLTGRDESGASKTSLRICSYLGGRGVVSYPVLNFNSYQAGQTGSIVFERMVNRQEVLAMTRCADLNVLTGEITLQELSDDEPNRLGEQSVRSWIIAKMPERCESHRVGLPSDRK